jgi:hypothetical protein
VSRAIGRAGAATVNTMAEDIPTTAAGDNVLASDSEREQVVARLNAAVSEGRLTLSEFSERSAAVYATRTRAELPPLVADLPEPADAAAGQLATVHAPAATTTPRLLPSGAAGSERILIGPIKRRGRWRLPAAGELSVEIGTIKLDLRDAELADSEVVLHARTGIGTIKVVVPEHIRVIVEGTTLLGAREIDENHIPPGVPAPTVRLRLDTGLGTVKVRVSRSSRKHFF